MSKIPDTSKQIMHEAVGRVLLLFLCVWNRDEALALVFDILLQKRNNCTVEL